MRKITFLGLFLLVAFLFVVPSAFSQSITIDSPVVVQSIRMNAMGGTHVAFADGLDSLITNPAAFRKTPPVLALSALDLGLSGPIFDIASVIIESMANSNPQSVLLSENVMNMLKSLYASMNVIGPITFGYVGRGLGFGFFSNSYINFSSTGTVPTITSEVEQDFLFSGGYTFRIPLPKEWNSTLDFGILLKAFVRGQIEITSSILELFSLLNNPSINIIYSQPFTLGIGIGIDSGLLYSYGERFSFGIVGKNLYAPTLDNRYDTFQSFLNSETPTMTNGIVPVDLSAGIMLSPYLGPVELYVSNLKLFLDYGDILDFVTHPATAKNPILHIGVGAEVVLLEILSLRAGFYDGLFSAGLGLDLTFFRLNMAMYGRELSTEPGLRPVYNLMIGIDFRI